ncbi:transposase [Reticulibacter mediterranei]|uniref:transposase n=1 Tax=Reticulibacter mediterranei TaxID=2778369 RepID=UPI0022A8AF27
MKENEWVRLNNILAAKREKRVGEVVYLITSLTPTQANPQRLLALVRGHWSIENSFHYVRDVSFGEDRSRLRTESASQILASLRNLALTLIHRAGSSQIAATRRHSASHPHKASAFLLPPKMVSAIIHKP